MMPALSAVSLMEQEAMFRRTRFALAVIDLASNRLAPVNAPLAALPRLDAWQLEGLDFLSLVSAEVRDIVQRVLAGVAVGLIDSCQGQGRWHTPNGAAFNIVGAIRPLDAATPHARAVVVAAPADEARPSEPWLTVDPRPAAFGAVDHDWRVSTESADDRACRLEGHLWRIAAEVKAAGISDLPRSGPGWWADPMLGGLSPRQREILRRLVAAKAELG